MNVYSLIARTRSEILDVLLSISFTSPAISIEVEILTRAARAVPASSVAKRLSKASGVKLRLANSAASCQRSFCP